MRIIRVGKKERRIENDGDCRQCGGSGTFNSSICNLCKGDGKVRYANCLGNCGRKFAMAHRLNKICSNCKQRYSSEHFREPHKVIFG